LEVEKSQALSLLGSRNIIYPEILEVVYRLRNVARDLLAIFPSDVLSWDVGVGTSLESAAKIHAFEASLYTLTDNLYRYRAFVEDDVFEKLHKLKGNLQDASVVVDRLTRPKEEDSIKYYSGRYVAEDRNEIYVTLLKKLYALYRDSDTLHYEITAAIKGNLNNNSLLDGR
jgi:predicted CopG family antitoxin